MSTWPFNSTLVHPLDDSTNRQESLSARSSVPHYPTDQPVAHMLNDLKAVLKGHIAFGDPTSIPCFEYIVVGGGAAGLALAARLAEDLQPGQSVCVVEAGMYHKDAAIDIPGAYGAAVGSKDYDWGYYTVPQPNLNGRELRSSAGRLLGGSSGINYLVRMRASSPEYDAWNEFGRGWDWNGLLPYFKAGECYKAYAWETDEIFPGITEEEDKEARRQESVFRGHSGPVHSTHNVIYTDLLKLTIQTTLELGIKTNRCPVRSLSLTIDGINVNDQGCGDSTGMFNIDTAVNREEGTRSYAANAYLRYPMSAWPQTNLIVLKGLYAAKILFDSNAQDAKATGLACLEGVDWKLPDTEVFPLNLRVNKEIIVSAGTYNTPRLLELSGVGNPAIISQFNIPTIVNLPSVGENLQDHISLASDFIVKEGVFTLDRLRNDPTYRAEQQKEYREKRTGAYATTCSAYGFFKLKDFLAETEINELKTELEREISRASNLLHKRQLEIQREYLDTNGVGDVELIMVPNIFASAPEPNTSYISLVVSVAHPVARGSVHISSSDPLRPPSINPQYLNNSFDLKILTKAAQFVRKLSETAPLRDIIVKPNAPGPDVQTYADFERYVRNNVRSMQHPIGTATMAPKSLGGVVDNELRVYGTQNVRVVDLSIAPLHLAAHVLDTAYAIGEKASKLFKPSGHAE